MSTLQCLYLEDDIQDQRNYKFWIETAWNNLGTTIPIKIEIIDDPIKAIEMIERAPDKYHLFVADILFTKPTAGEKTIKTKEDKRPEGLKAISSVFKINPNIAILAISDGNGGLEREARDAGAGEYYSKQFNAQKDSKLQVLGENLEKILKNRIYEMVAIEIIPEEIYENNPALAVIIDTIQSKNVAVLVTKLLEGKCKITPYFIRAGLSGAAILRIECNMKVHEGSVPKTRDIIMKVSKDAELIKKEFLKRKEVDSFPANLFIQFIDKVVDSQGWYAIGAAYQHNAATLIDWLVQQKGETVENVKKTLEILFLGDGLVKVYKNCVNKPQRPNTVLWDYMKGSRQARVLLACEDFAKLAKNKDTFGAFDRQLIEKFLKPSKRISDLDEEEIKLGTTFCHSHGDLHGRNILVDQYGTPHLIDPANIDELHWALDIARLSVDLIVSGLDYGDESHDWKKIEEWCLFASNFIQGKELKESVAGNPNCMIFTALKWLREKLSEIHYIDKDKDLKPEWEFRLALAIEFMRAAYRHQELPTPKRVLGLIAACIALKETSSAYNEFKKLC